MAKRAESRFRNISCVICGKKFLTNHSQGKYCGEKCRSVGNRTSWKKYGDKNRLARRAYHRKYYAKNKERIKKRIAKYLKTPAGKRMAKKRFENYTKKHPDRYRATQAVRIAKTKGILKKQSCLFCGNKKTDAHHPDYKKPLDIVWLCRACHLKIHKKVGIYIEDGSVVA